MTASIQKKLAHEDKRDSGWNQRMSNMSNQEDREFVDRNDELAMFGYIIGSIQGQAVGGQAPITTRVVNFVGVHGIGKSLLLHKIAELYANNHTLMVLIDFVEDRFHQEFCRRAIISTILAQVERFVAASERYAPTLHQYRDLKKLFDSDNERQGDVSSAMEMGIKNLLKSTLELDRYCPIVIALDTVELAPQFLLDWIEDLVFLLLETGNLVLLTAGRIPLNWRNLNTKRLTKNVPLQPFGADDVKAQAAALGVDASNPSLASMVYQLLCGYPKGSKHIIERFGSILVQKDIRPERLAELEKTAIHEVTDDLLVHHVPRNEPELLTVIKLLACVRQFDLNIMRDLILTFAPHCFDESEERVMKCFTIIGKLHQTRLVTSSTSNRWQLALMARQLVSASLRVAEPQKFIEINRTAVEIYEQIIPEVPEVEQGGWLVELLFHFATLLKLENASEDDLLTKFQNEIQRQIHKQQRPAGALHTLLEQLFQYLKHDHEIKSITGRLHATLLNYVATLMVQAEQTVSRCRLTVTRDGESYSISFSGGNDATVIERTVAVPDELRARLIDRFQDIVTKLNFAYDQHRQGHRIRDDAYSLQLGELREIGGLMFDTYLPVEVQQSIASTALPLVVETNDSSLPWELAHDRSDFVSCRIPLSRNLKEGYSFKKEPGTIPVTRLNALLIANPTEDLPAAEREVHRINEVLTSAGALVDILVKSEASSLNILQKLRSGKYNVIHYSGHAAFNPQKSSQSHLVCANSTPLFAEQIERILQGNPLVFLDACHSGAITSTASGTQIGTLQEGLIASFLRKGAVACIGALWAVDDELAAELAVHFYQSIADGATIGEALRIARTQIRKQDAHSISPYAFAMYGDPMYKLFAR